MLALAAAAQTPPASRAPQPATQPAAEAPGKYVGVASCVNSGCHGSTVPLQAQRIRQNEYYTWLNNDRHAQAYNVLFNEKSARIARNMKLRRKAYQEAVCLDCHSTNVPPSLVSGRIDLEDGVQCEACHGPASGWRDEHTQAGWTHAQSVQRGMIDLRSVPTRGTLCLSCHMGNRTKEVDHELIASGHPILAFELDNYSETMPAHWNRNDTHGVRAWATGQVVAFRDSLENLARHARGEKWPEFSDMSCYNCHHALKTSQWRQERGWPYRAGLPSWSPQHWAVLRLLLSNEEPGSRAELDGLVAQVAEKVARMNDPAGVARVADETRRAVEPFVGRVDALKWSDGRIRELMTALTNDGEFITRSDVHSAEQTALALQSLASELTRRNPRLLRSPLTRAIDDLFTELQNRDDYEPSRFVAKLAEVRAAL
jgi:hypothetical protein